MPQTSVVFSSILGPNCNRQVQPGMGERVGGANNGSRDLIFQDGRLTSGSLEALMEHLVPTVDYYPDVSALDPRELEWQGTGRGALGFKEGCFCEEREAQAGLRVGRSSREWMGSRASAASWVFTFYSAMKVLSSGSRSDSPAASKQREIREDMQETETYNGPAPGGREFEGGPAWGSCDLVAQTTSWSPS